MHPAGQVQEPPEGVGQDGGEQGPGQIGQEQQSGQPVAPEKQDGGGQDRQVQNRDLDQRGADAVQAKKIALQAKFSASWTAKAAISGAVSRHIFHTRQAATAIRI